MIAAPRPLTDAFEAALEVPSMPGALRRTFDLLESLGADCTGVGVRPSDSGTTIGGTPPGRISLTLIAGRDIQPGLRLGAAALQSLAAPAGGAGLQRPQWSLRFDAEGLGLHAWRALLSLLEDTAGNICTARFHHPGAPFESSGRPWPWTASIEADFIDGVRCERAWDRLAQPGRALASVRAVCRARLDLRTASLAASVDPARRPQAVAADPVVRRISPAEVAMGLAALADVRVL
jgi:hypothetical protein